MSIRVVHQFVNAKADGPDSTVVKPSDWNDTHTVETDGGGGIVVGRDTSGPGPLQELPLAYSVAGAIGKWVANVVGSFGLPRGTSAQRTATPADGEMRFNTDLNIPEVFVGGSWQPFQIGTPAAVRTGTLQPTHNTTPDPGWIMWVDGTIGDAASGATVRANDDTEALYTMYYDGYADAICPVTGGRGADAATDFAAHKPLQIPRGPGRALVIAGTGAGGLTVRTLGGIVGTETHGHGAFAGGPNDVVGRGDQGGGLNVASQFHSHGITVNAGDSMQPSGFINVMIKL